MTRTATPVRPAGLPPLLAQVIRAAAGDGRAAGHAAALQALARLYVLSLPARGVLAPGDELSGQIDDVAKRYLNRTAAERQFNLAVSGVVSLSHRDAIETAHASLVDVSELAHYYAGLAAGIALAELGRTVR